MTASTNGEAASPAPNDDGNKQPYRVVALDLDGTLLNGDHKLSPSTIAGLRELHSKGLMIVLATGRAISTVYEHIVALGLPTALPVVCSNGAAGLRCRVDPAAPHGVHAEPLFLTTVPQNVAVRTMQLALAQNHVCQYYVENKIYAHPSTESHYQLTEEYIALTGSETVYIPPSEFESKMIRLGEPTKQLVLFPSSQQDGMMEMFEKALRAPHLLVDGRAATLIRGSLGWFLEVLHPHVHKGAGLERLCAEHLHVPLSQVVAFGDGDNDLEFLQMAGRGCAMANARTVVKEIADQIIDYTNNEEGVLRTLLDMEKQGLLALNEA